MRLIGDLHGLWNSYRSLLRLGTGPSIALGDIGFGFGPQQFPVIPEALCIRGNHDDPAVARQHPNYLGDVGYRAPIFFISGGYSIDYARRTPGLSWWPEEQLTAAQRSAAVCLYQEVKPRIVVSHDAPASAARRLLTTQLLKAHGYERSYLSAKLEGIAFSHLSEMMDVMLQAHEPELWVFGHFHLSSTFTIEGCATQFVVLNELESREVEGLDFEDTILITVDEEGVRHHVSVQKSEAA